MAGDQSIATEDRVNVLREKRFACMGIQLSWFRLATRRGLNPKLRSAELSAYELEDLSAKQRLETELTAHGAKWT